MCGMGFKDIELFNLAFLARQAWRVLMEPETLSTHVLQAVHFLGKDFLEAEVGSPRHEFGMRSWKGRSYYARD